MKRIPILSVLLTLPILAGFLFLFPLEWVLLLFTLLALISIQVIVVRRHLHVVGNTAARRRSGVDLGKVSLESRAPLVSTGEAPEGGAVSGDGAELPFDPAVFSRFRAHLDAAEREEAPPPPQPATEGATEGASGEAAPPPGEAEAAEPAGPNQTVTSNPPRGNEENVKVVLSPAARRKSAAAKAAAAPEQDAPAKEEQDLFADLRTQPLDTGVSAVAGAASKPEEKTKGVNQMLSAEEKSIQVQVPTAPKQGDAGEQEMLLKLAEEALEKGDRAGAAAGLEQVLRLQDEDSGPLPWRVRLAQARLAVLEGNHSQAVEDFEELLKWHPRLEETEYVAQIDQLTSPVSGTPGAELRVTMLLKLLAVFRQASDRTAMDRIYVLIEKAQEQSGDEKKLIQTYKNHLEIKTVMEDVEGQLDLIDQIGNRYFKLGDTEAARKFYEQGLKLREAQQAASEQAGTPTPR